MIKALLFLGGALTGIFICTLVQINKLREEPSILHVFQPITEEEKNQQEVSELERMIGLK